MKLDQLSYFLETARQEHVGKASRILGISPSAISHSIAALEEELGRKLFEKRGKYIALTDHGKVLKARAEHLLEEARDLKESLSSDSVEWEGHFRMGASHHLCAGWLAPAWAEIHKQHPKVSGEIYTLRSVNVLDAVAASELDFGVCFSPQAHPDVDAEVIHQGQLVIIVRKGHPLMKKPAQKRFEALNQYPAVLPKSFQGIDVCERHPIFEKYGIRPNASLLFDSYEVAVEQVAHSDSWSFFPDLFLEKANSRVNVLAQPEEWDAPYTLSALRPRGRRLPAALECVVENLRKKFKPYPQ